MNGSLQALFQPGELTTNLFSPTSRYYGIGTATIQKADRMTMVYLRRRFIPPPENYALLQEHIITDGERLDNITAQYLGDPEQFWRVCDPNNVIRPEELTETPGLHIRITLPPGIPR